MEVKGREGIADVGRATGGREYYRWEGGSAGPGKTCRWEGLRCVKKSEQTSGPAGKGERRGWKDRLRPWMRAWLALWRRAGLSSEAVGAAVCSEQGSCGNGADSGLGSDDIVLTFTIGAGYFPKPPSHQHSERKHPGVTSPHLLHTSALFSAVPRVMSLAFHTPLSLSRQCSGAWLGHS